MRLRYGMNPHQTPATWEPVEAGTAPLRVISGLPSYVNLLDAIGGWQLVHEAALAFDRPAAASFKHVSPAGAAVAGPIDPAMAAAYRLSPSGVGALTGAYARARDADPKSSYGDFVAVSHPVDLELADFLRGVVSDGIIAPGFEPGVVAALAAKKSGRFLILEANPSFTPPPVEVREVYGLRLTQPVDAGLPALSGDLLLGAVITRYTQSNSVVYVRDGMALGVGAGQQSRIDCTALAGAKVDTWWLRRHPSVPTPSPDRLHDRVNAQLAAAAAVPDPASWLARLDGVAFVSDGALPFADNVAEARRHGVSSIAEPGGSTRSAEIAAECRRRGVELIQTGRRLFRH
ncbi:phosphoribosylaminoimidazolecarboxamide formyltransferase [Actinoplanes sp. NPDC051411]|uniref:phosphoribosylaminoimidazolecarboxamide formyltransferase n=1 Tax=Actinoplanes sp. NPDC051411 TaxID=3155522 RepID=UPI00343AC6D6